MDVKLGITLTPAEADEVIAGLKKHASDINELAERILSEAKTQYKGILLEEQEAKGEEEEDDGRKKDNM